MSIALCSGYRQRTLIQISEAAASVKLQVHWHGVLHALTRRTTDAFSHVVHNVLSICL
jgi:hypothetical protein